MGFTLCKTEQPLQGRELQQNEAQKDYSIQKKEPTVHRCLLILDLKPYPETTATQPSDAFLHLKETSLNTTWEVEHFRLFFCFSSCWFIGLELRTCELFKFPKYWKRDVNLLRWILDLENISLKQNLRLKTFTLYPFYFFICCLGAPWLTFGHYWGNSFTYLVLITAFVLSTFGPKVTQGGWVSAPCWVPSGLW